MKITIGDKEFIELLCVQLEYNFRLNKTERTTLITLLPKALLKTAKCFQENTNKYYWNNNQELIFNPYHSGQYSIFLYFLSREVVGKFKNTLADKIYYLNKMLNSCDLYHSVQLPNIFFFDHSLGSVLGRASYGNYLIFQQNCTVGANHGIYPRMGEFVWLFANTTIIGNTIIGNNVFISAGTFIKDEIIPDNTIVFGKSPNLTFKHKPEEYFYKASPFKIHKELYQNKEKND